MRFQSKRFCFNCMKEPEIKGSLYLKPCNFSIKSISQHIPVHNAVIL